MRDLDPDEQWRFLKDYDCELNNFKSMIVNPIGKRHLDQIILELNISKHHIHIIKKTNINYPTNLNENEIKTRSFSVPIEEQWTYFFYNELDWTQIQIIK